MRTSRTNRARSIPGGLAESNKQGFARARRADGKSYIGDQMTWHYKPNKGGLSVPCDVCGALGMREGDRHRALEFGSPKPHPAAVYVKTRRVAFGHDWEEDFLDSYGKRVG